MPDNIRLNTGIFMKKLFIIYVLTFLSCDQSTKDESHSQKAEERKDSSITQVKLDTEVLKAKSLNVEDSILYNFFSNLNYLEKYIDPKSGVYCIESGVSATPTLEKLQSQTELLGKSSFLFLYRDIAFIKKDAFVNPENFDPCSSEVEGFYIFNLKKAQTILQDIYKLNQIQTEQAPNLEYLKSLRDIDEQLTKSVVVHFKEKHGDLIQLKLFFIQRNKKFYLSILDLRDCGV